VFSYAYLIQPYQLKPSTIYDPFLTAETTQLTVTPVISW